MRSILDHIVGIRPDSNGTFVAYVLAIEVCHASGRTPDEARTELANVFEMIREEPFHSGGHLPPDVDLTATSAN